MGFEKPSGVEVEESKQEESKEIDLDVMSRLENGFFHVHVKLNKIIFDMVELKKKLDEIKRLTEKNDH